MCNMEEKFGPCSSKRRRPHNMRSLPSLPPSPTFQSVTAAGREREAAGEGGGRRGGGLQKRTKRPLWPSMGGSRTIPSCSSLLHTSMNSVVQGWAKVQFPVSVNMRRKNCVLLQENANFSSHIHRTWELYLSPSLYTHLLTNLTS